MEAISTRQHGFRFLCVLILCSYFPTAMAAFIGVQAGAGVWNPTVEGHITHQGTRAETDRDFGFGNDLSGFFYLAVEHPLPFVPNIRLSRYSVINKGDKTVSASSEFSFAGTAYSNGTAISSELRWDEDDAVFYYQLLDRIVSFDLGLGVKKLDGKISVTSGGVRNTLHIEETLPTAYAMLAVMIPRSGLSISVDKIQTFAGDSEISQTNTRIRYETAFHLGIEAGYRSSTVNLDQIATVAGELNFTGPFVNLLVHF